MIKPKIIIGFGKNIHFGYNENKEMKEQIEKIIDQMKTLQPAVSTDSVQLAFDYLREKTKKMNPSNQDRIISTTIKNIQNFTLKPVIPELITAMILNEVLYFQPTAIHELNKQFGKEISKITRAFHTAAKHLKGKTLHLRNLFDHTLSTTLLLAESEISHQTIIASLLKHLPEFSDFGHKKIRDEFDEEILNIIINVNKLKKIKSAGRQNSNPYSPQMILGLAGDWQAILIKICSVIDLLKNSHEINPLRHQQLAIEAMQIYAPLTDILGSWRLKWQLEDYAFKILKPVEFQKIEKKFNVDEKKNREKYIEKTKKELLDESQKRNINCTIDGRFKHFYSIHKKMTGKKKQFNEVYDVFALRVIVDSVDDCYKMLGIIHSLWPPKPRRVKDYIAIPKTNYYQSLHTTVYGFNGRMTEFQIRTREMDDRAKYGIAAHWYYKNKPEEPKVWINQLRADTYQAIPPLNIESQNQPYNIFNKIFVYTPKKEILSLPQKATPIDFAYLIHSELGNHCVGAEVNGKIVPLDQELKDGDCVKIISQPHQTKPKKDWLDFVKTDLAKRMIKKFFEQPEN